MQGSNACSRHQLGDSLACASAVSLRRFPAGIYQNQPTIADNLSQQQLLQLMMLADLFGVPKVLAAAAAALAAVLAAGQLDWDTALQLLQLPQSCVLQPDFRAVHEPAVSRMMQPDFRAAHEPAVSRMMHPDFRAAHEPAVSRMMQQLGDLEKVWASDALQQLLLALPFDVLLQLLQHEDTRVATENTVVFTIQRWHSAQGAGQCCREQVQQLVCLVRMRHCTPYYAGTVMPHSVVRQGTNRSALPLMRECCTPGGFDTLTTAECSVLQQYPAWSAAPRPKSEQQPVLEWRLLLGTLKTAVEQLSSSGRTIFVGVSAPSIVQGQPMQLRSTTHTPRRAPARQRCIWACSCACWSCLLVQCARCRHSPAY
jgi:hypothetical protein